MATYWTRPAILDAQVCLACEAWVVPGPHPRLAGPTPPEVARVLGRGADAKLVDAGVLCDGPYAGDEPPDMRDRGLGRRSA